MNFAKFLLETDNEYNGHKQTTMQGLSVKKALKLCKKLEEEVGQKYFFAVELFTDGSYTIYQKNFFPVGNPTGRDRLILSVEN